MTSKSQVAAMQSRKSTRGDRTRHARIVIVTAFAVMAMLTWVSACSDSPGGIGPTPDTQDLPEDSTGVDQLADTTPIVSDPVIDNLAASIHRSVVRRASAVTPLQGDVSDVAYVSLRPGTVPGAERATIQRRGSLTTLIAAMDEGGLDPVPIPAADGDSIDIKVELTGGGVRQFAMRVPATRRPKVVRTHPPPKKKDVALNAGIVIVFSEPVNAATLTPSSVQLFRGAIQVAGTVRVLEGATAAAVFEPQGALDPETTYRLVVTGAVRDLDGDALEAHEAVDFTTGTEYAPFVSRVTVLPDTSAVLVGSRVQLTALTTAGDDTMRIRVFGVPIAWMSDNPAVASVSAAGLVTGLADGEARIRAVVLNQQGVSGSAIVLVSSSLATVNSLELATPSPVAPLTGRIELSAIARDSVGNVLPFRTVTWSTSDPSVATVEPTTGGKAWVTAIATGAASVIATSEGKSDTLDVTVVRPGPYATLSAGGGGSQGYTCGLTTDGWALCWGNNHAGHLGITTASTVITPTPVARALRFSRIATGGPVTCGLTSSGTAYCWGDNSMGTLGIGTTTGPDQCIYGPCAMAPVEVSGAPPFAELDVGAMRFACALTSGGTAYCWGSNERGMLGLGSAAGPEECDPFAQDTGAPCSRSPVAVAGGLRFTALSAGWGHTCGLTATGEAFCWGTNELGQVGDGTTTDRYSPVRVAGGLTFASISAGSSHTCALTSAGDAYCWGLNGSGQLGIGAITSFESCRVQTQDNPCSTVPLRVSGSERYASVSGGGYHTCAVTPDGAAYCWGWNGQGVVGDGTTTDRLTPTAVGGSLTFASVSAGDSHTCGVTDTRIAYCWGNNQSGALGTGTTSQEVTTTPTRVMGQP